MRTTTLISLLIVIYTFIPIFLLILFFVFVVNKVYYTFLFVNLVVVGEVRAVLFCR